MARRSLVVSFLLVLLLVPMAKAGEQDLPDGLKALKHEDPKVRYNSVVIVGKLGKNAKFLAPALYEMLADPDEAVRLKVAETLWVIDKPQPKQIVPILKMALNHEDLRLKLEGLALVQQMGNAAREVVPDVQKALRDKDFNTQLQAVLAVSALGVSAKETIPDLLEVLRKDEIGFLEANVAVALSSMGSQAVPELKKGLADKDVKIRRMSAYALSLIGGRAYKAVTELRKALVDENAVVRSFAAHALGNIGVDAEPAVADLEKCLKDSDDGLRINAALALWKIHRSTRTVPVLAEALSTAKTYDDRIQAARGLGVIGPNAVAALPELAKALNDSSYGVRAESCKSLARVGERAKAMIPRMEGLLTDAAPVVRVQAARAICLLQGEATEMALKVLIESLEDASKMVRKEAALAVGDLKQDGSKAEPGILALMRDEDADVRQAARTALRQINPELAKKIGLDLK
jgi:HEAT repeat protein